MLTPDVDFEKRPLVAMLHLWQTNCRRSQIANYKAMSHFGRRNYFFGVPTVALSAFVGTSVFASLNAGSEVQYPIVIGAMSVLASVLAALHTFFRWGELAAKSKAAAAEYGILKREIDQILANAATGEEIGDDSVTGIRKNMDAISRSAPDLPNKIWTAATKEIPTQRASS